MSAFYDQASLVVVPSGYKSGKIYAQKPLTTDGQLTFTRASTATRVNASGLIEAVASGVPRLDYTDSTCPKLLLEPQRTNKQTESENINATDYSQNVEITISSNAGTAPDGATTADKIVPTAVSNYHAIRTGKATPNGYDIISCFVKASGYNYVQLASWADPGNYVNFDLTDGTLGTVATATVYGIQSYGNGWYRIWANVQASGTGLVGIQVVTSKTAEWAQSFSGNGTDGVLVWGVQIEAATYPTSYVKTEAAAVTRLADAVSKSSISTLIGSATGSVFFDVDEVRQEGAADIDLLTLENQTNGALGAYVILFRSNGNIRLYAMPGTNQLVLKSGNNLGQRLKIAFAYSSGDFVFYVNGVQTYSSSSIGTADGLSKIGINSNVGKQGKATFNQVLVFKTRLSNAQLAELTTL
jgi:hypothetical protein